MRRLLEITLLTVLFAGWIHAQDQLPPLSLQHQVETEADSGLFHRLQRSETWQSGDTAVIVCDMWDAHHCYRAVQRGTEMAPRLNALLEKLRAAGVTVIHAPSSCMAAYADTPARQRAIEAPAADSHPEKIAEWCHQIPSEQRGVYPIDQSDGGEDDTPEEHAAWEQELVRRGLNPRQPWKRQMDAIAIDQKRDYISDSGVEIWNILADKKIDNVILTGVHTNMCVLGRPFGLRRMAAAGKNVVLVRDLTDTMYNPASKPYVSHFTGTDLIIDHIERYVCPTISSDQILGGQPFRFKNDKRKRVAMLIGESEYFTHTTLPPFAIEHLGKDYQVDIIHASASDGNAFPGIERIAQADALLVSVRRRALTPEALKVVQDYVAAGKPVLGIRTANHAFTLRNKPAPEGHVNWPEWDAEVFGGNYTNHYGNQMQTTVQVVETAKSHPILEGVEPTTFPAGGSLYRVAPLQPGANVLLTGSVQGKPSEPVAWTFKRADGGRSFYTSLGHVKDFATPAFQQLLKNAIEWSLFAPRT
ncbi:isochorismatase family protein [Roseimaritima ulvae]|uniref:Trehalose utilization n=1 Tax=Roseimaritima ulvae TaxID=980254 RepID=A0A5B9QQE7_9BACT|nr:isochorismatase family protein [Roseimaritima ulvae]QEG39735.1 Trehalose utilization [Roseimaritima ulvae]